MPREPWLSDESRMAAVMRQALSRALRRPIRLLVPALLATAAVVSARALLPPTYQATLYLRLSEGDVTRPGDAPRPPRAIREYISAVALSRGRVEQLMRKHGWSTQYLARNPEGAIEDFRGDIEIAVERNYFLYERRQGDPARTAQVSISLSGPDAEKTRAVVHEIGQIILADQTDQRRIQLEQARDLLAAQLGVARARSNEIRATIDRLSRETAGAGGSRSIGLRAQIAALEVQGLSALDRVAALERRADAIAFTAAAESRRLGLNFEVFDESLETRLPRLTPFQLARLAAVVLAVALLLTAATVGSFDDRIYGPQDLEASGLPLFGAVPRFPGDDVGAYRARISPEQASP